MKIVIAPLAEAAAALVRFDPGAVVSLVSPRMRLRRLVDRPHAVLHCHDIEAPRAGRVAPSMGCVAAICSAAHAAAGAGGVLLVHCAAGLSRAPAAGLVAAWAVTGGEVPERSVEALARVAPWAQPNRLIVALGAVHLGLDAGRLLEQLEALFPWRPRGPHGAVGRRGTLVVLGK